MSRPSDDDLGALSFARNVVTLLEQGQFTATYKYAVLLALISLCHKRASEGGEAPEEVTTRELAREIVDLYRPQLQPYGETGRLRQNAGQEPAVFGSLERFGEDLRGDPSRPLSQASRAAPEAFDRLLTRVERTLIEMPLPKLQTLRPSRGELRFIYDFPVAGDHRRLRFRPGAGRHLIELADLLRPLIERHWAQKVAELNRLEYSALEGHLFPKARIPTRRVRSLLGDVQKGRCFYCGSTALAEVDHFLPFDRRPDNGIFNLVLACRRCNGSKSDSPASLRFLAGWLGRFRKPTLDELREGAAKIDWEADPAPTLASARAIYLNFQQGVRAWAGADAPVEELD